MPELGTYGSVRGALSNERPYRDPRFPQPRSHGMNPVAAGSARHYPFAMREMLNDIEAGKLTGELRRRGIPPGQHLRVVVESIDADEPSLMAMNAAGGAFNWLANEPDLYSDADLVERFCA